MSTLDELRPWLAEQVRDALEVYGAPHTLFEHVLTLVQTTSLESWDTNELEALRHTIEQGRRATLSEQVMRDLDPWRCLHGDPDDIHTLRDDQLFTATRALLSPSHYLAAWSCIRALSLTHTLEAIRQDRVTQYMEQLQLCEMFYEELCARLQEHLFGDVWT